MTFINHILALSFAVLALAAPAELRSSICTSCFNVHCLSQLELEEPRVPLPCVEADPSPWQGEGSASTRRASRRLHRIPEGEVASTSRHSKRLQGIPRVRC